MKFWSNGKGDKAFKSLKVRGGSCSQIQKNIRFAKFLMHFQPFKGHKFQKISQGNMPPDPSSS